MSRTRQIVHPGKKPREVLNAVEIEDLCLERVKIRKILTWLEVRQKELQDMMLRAGSFRDDCPNHMHMRSIQGALQENMDISQMLDETINPQQEAQR